MHLDLSNAGMGDAVTAAWIAEGRKGLHPVTFNGGRNRRVLELLGQVVTDESGGIDLGDKGVWQYELAAAAMQNVALTRTTPWGTHITVRKPIQMPARPYLWQQVLPDFVEPRRPQANIPAAAWQSSEALLDGHAGRPIALLFPCASYKTRMWPLRYWLRLAGELEDRGVFTYAMDGWQGNVKDFPRYGYGFSIETVAATMLRSHIVVGNDSGPAHLAGTLEVPTIGIIGACDPRVVWGHLESVRAMRASPSRVPCVGCHFQREAGFAAMCDEGCDALRAVHAHEVAEAVFRILEEGHEPRCDTGQGVWSDRSTD